MKSARIIQITFLIVVLASILSACAGPATNTPTPNVSPFAPTVAAKPAGTIKVGSKDFTEEFIIANMYALLLEDAGLTVERKLNLGGTPVAHAALLKGDIDLYPEYTSTALLTVLKEKRMQDPNEIFKTVKTRYEEQFKLTWLQAAPFNDTQALAMTAEGSNKYGIKSYSDLAQKAPQLVLGGPAEFSAREDSLPALQQTYGGFKFKEYRQLGTGSLRYQALLSGQIDVVVAFSTDGEIEGNKLVLLKDDKGVFPVYQIAPVVRLDALDRAPQIRGVLDKVAPLLTDAVMSGLNWQVDGPAKKEPADVARAFLKEKGLIK